MSRTLFLLIASLFCNLGQSQTLNISFEYPVELNGTSDYYITLMYYDHDRLEYVRDYLFLDNYQMATYTFNQQFPIEVDLEISFRGINEVVKLYLNPKRRLSLHINQQVQLKNNSWRDTIPDEYYKLRYRFEGKDGELNDLMMQHKRLASPSTGSQYGSMFTSFYRQNRGTKDVDTLKQVLFRFIDFRIKLHLAEQDKIDLGKGRAAEFLKAYAHDQLLLTIGYDALYHLSSYGRKYGFEESDYDTINQIFLNLQCGNHRLRKFYNYVDKIRVWNSNQKLNRYAQDIPFESYMRSENFEIQDVWRQEFYDSLAKGVSPFSAVYQIKRRHQWKNRDVYATITNDMYFNGKMYNAYYSDSSLLAALKASKLPKEVQLIKALERLKESEGSPLQGANSYISSAPMRKFYLSESRKQLFIDFLKDWQKSEYRKSWEVLLNTHSGRKGEFDIESEIGLPILHNDAQVFHACTASGKKHKYIFLFDETYSNYKARYQMVMIKRLRQKLKEDAEVIALIDWGAGRGERDARELKQLLADEGLTNYVKLFITDHYLGYTFYNETNLRSPWNIIVLDKNNHPVRFNPKKSGYHTFDPQERMLLGLAVALTRAAPAEESMYGGSHNVYIDDEVMELYEIPEEVESVRNKRQGRSGSSPLTKPAPPERSGVRVVVEAYQPMLNRRGSLSQSLLLISTRKPAGQNEFETFLDSVFNKGRGWYMVKSDLGSVHLSQNHYEAVKAERTKRWIKEPNTSKLYIFDSEKSTDHRIGSMNYDSENRTITVSDKGVSTEYFIMFYDEEFVLLYPKKKYDMELRGKR